jgi:hypothetical protein
MNVGLAVLRVAAALTLYAAGLVDAAVIRPMPLWVYAALAATFGVVALGLVLGHQNDRRAAWLGGTLALVASPFAVPLLANGPLAWLISVRPDAFLGAFVWEFVACFPTDVHGRRANIVRGIVAAGVFVGIYLAGTSLLGLWISPADVTPTFAPMLAVTSVSSNPTVFYWPLLLGVAVPAFFALLWRAWVAEGAAARQVRVFVAALLIGLGPIAVEVFVEGVWRSYEHFVHSPAIEPWVGAIMFAALASLPVATAYSVLFDRVVSVRLVLQKALQYALARYIVLALTLIPFGGLILFLAQHRDEPLTSLLSGARRPLVLGGLGIVGVLALRQRPRLLGGLDRRYFREPFDAGRILERLMARSAPDLGDLGARICDEVGRAFHARVYVLLADDARTVLRDTGERLQPLSAMTPLVNPPERGEPVLDVGAPASRAWLDRLPAHERTWLAGANISVIAPIRSHELGPIGLIALTPRLSELPYTDEDRRFLATVASAAGLAFDRFHHHAPPIAASSEPPGRECERCFSVYASEARHCLCGAALVEAPVPHVLRGVFRLEQRIAAGSMGVVYRAVDLGLGRTVAIKTLPGVTDQHRAALVQEARAMARVTHANLAVVHGVETWRGVSFLVQEYLEKGTLARRLFTSKLSVAEAIDLGCILADLLEHLHCDNLIHCDIKPSNIGYTSDEVVKLFDFGLAQRLEGREPSPSTETATFVGTPVYMSPEAIRGEPPSPAVDLWALSVVLYEAIAGRRPFDGATTPDVLAEILRGGPPRLTEVAPGTPDGVAAFFERALNRDRSRRPASAGELGRALDDVRGALGSTSRSSAARAGIHEVQT